MRPRHKAHPQRDPDDLPVTSESIAAAKRQQQIDRAKVSEKTGVTFDDDGKVGLSIANAIWHAVNGSQHGKH